MTWAVEEDLEAASDIRDWASSSEMKVSEKMTWYCGVVSEMEDSWAYLWTHLRVCK